MSQSSIFDLIAGRASNGNSNGGVRGDKSNNGSDRGGKEVDRGREGQVSLGFRKQGSAEDKERRADSADPVYSEGGPPRVTSTAQGGEILLAGHGRPPLSAKPIVDIEELRRKAVEIGRVSLRVDVFLGLAKAGGSESGEVLRARELLDLLSKDGGTVGGGDVEGVPPDDLLAVHDGDQDCGQVKEVGDGGREGVREGSDVLPDDEYIVDDSRGEEVCIEELQVHEYRLRNGSTGKLARGYFEGVRGGESEASAPEEPERQVFKFEIDVDGLKYDNLIKPLPGLIKRKGGKSVLKDWLVRQFPRNVVYVEPFGGSFQVLLNKPWRDPIEIINDYDADIVNFYRWVQYKPRELADLINSLPTHESLALGFRAELREKRLTGIERAAGFYIAYATMFNGGGSSYASSVHSRIDTEVSKQDFIRVCERLRGVDIRSRDCWNIIEMANKKVSRRDVFFYLDPPYDETSGYETLDRGSTVFGWPEQQRLFGSCVSIHEMGNKFIQTNSYTDRLVAMYGGVKGFYLQRVEVRYSISGDGDTRGEASELVVSNFKIGEWRKV